MALSVLIIDDDKNIRLSIKFLLSKLDWGILEAESPKEALEILQTNKVDIIILDMNFTADTTSGKEGVNFLKRLQKEKITVPVIAMTAWAQLELAIEAMKLGCKDFIEKPWDNKKLVETIKNTLEEKSHISPPLHEQQYVAENTLEKVNINFHSLAMQELYSKIDKVAKTDATILLTGENGTGKSTIGELIHQLSNKNSSPLITANMGAIPNTLFESEMFGHKKGAFTGASESRVGRFKLAHNSTIFLDEIATLSYELQGKLLRVLETGEFEPVGSSNTEFSNARIISASNANFEKLISENSFREDLFFRLNTIELYVPSLRERTDDIKPLANFFLKKYAHKYNKKNMVLSECALNKLSQYEWPGNVRELSHVIESSVILASDEFINKSNLTLNKKNLQINSEKKLPLMTLDNAEEYLVNLALNKTKKNIQDASKLLGITPSALYRRLYKFNLKND